MKRVFVSTVPFGAVDPKPLELLKTAGHELVINPLGRKLTSDDLAAMIAGFDALIAGTEQITEAVLDKAPSLQIISRVGVGLDGLDLPEVRRRGIRLAYTPEAPVKAVAELTIGLMLGLLRHIPVVNQELHLGHWERKFGRRIGEAKVGIVGYGRIGKATHQLLAGFQPKEVMISDLETVTPERLGEYVRQVPFEELLVESDIITLHVPLTAKTSSMLGLSELKAMKEDAIIINTARGGIIDEDALYEALSNNLIAGAAIDVFRNEPYFGKLAELPNCLLTAHMGSMSVDCRSRMEIEATEDVIRYFADEPLHGEVPAYEYEVAK